MVLSAYAAAIGVGLAWPPVFRNLSLKAAFILQYFDCETLVDL